MSRVKNKAIIVDLDGTMCNTDHRQHLVKAKKWDEFYEALIDDPIHQWCDDLVFSIIAEMRWVTIFVSGRPEKYRELTREWFKKKWGVHGLHSENFILHMRPDGDFRQDAIVKTEIYKRDIEPFYEIQFCIDDRKQVVEAWRALGLVCLQCAEGDF